jgi:hypothetical protein
MRHALLLSLLGAALLAPSEARSAPADLRRAEREEPRDLGRPLPWFGVRLGGLAAVHSAGGDAWGAGGGGFYALFDGRYFLADASLDLLFGSRTHFVALGLGAYYPFRSDGGWSPYLGGGLKLGWTRFGGDGTFGVIPFLAGGFVTNREGYVQVRGEFGWFVATSREERSDRPGEQGWRGHGPFATLGLAF